MQTVKGGPDGGPIDLCVPCYVYGAAAWAAPDVVEDGIADAAGFFSVHLLPHDLERVNLLGTTCWA
jgi:hypothetical protein